MEFKVSEGVKTLNCENTAYKYTSPKDCLDLLEFERERVGSLTYLVHYFNHVNTAHCISD